MGWQHNLVENFRYWYRNLKPKSFWNGFWLMKFKVFSFLVAEKKTLPLVAKITSRTNFVYEIIWLHHSILGFIYFQEEEKKLNSLPRCSSSSSSSSNLVVQLFQFMLANIQKKTSNTTHMHRQMRSQKWHKLQGNLTKKKRKIEKFKGTCLCLSLFNNNKLEILLNNCMFWITVGEGEEK